MTSLTWSSEAQHIVGCGVDCEATRRFGAYTDAEAPMPFVFTRREVEGARRQADPARALCLCFTCKEALFKAAGPYDYTACEVPPTLRDDALLFHGELTLDPALKTAWGVSRVMARSLAAGSDEVISTVYLLAGESG